MCGNGKECPASTKPDRGDAGLEEAILSGGSFVSDLLNRLADKTLYSPDDVDDETESLLQPLATIAPLTRLMLG